MSKTGNLEANIIFRTSYLRIKIQYKLIIKSFQVSN